MKILVRIKKCLILVIIQLSQNIMRLVAGKMKDETTGVAIQELFWIKAKAVIFFGI